MDKKPEINEPLHYNGERFECIDVMEDNMTREAFQGFLSGNVFKYIWRYKEKGGLFDVAKASWYVNRLYKSLEDDEIRKTALGDFLVGNEEDEEDEVEKELALAREEAEDEEKYIVKVYSDTGHSATAEPVTCYMNETIICSHLEEATRFTGREAADRAAELVAWDYRAEVVRLDKDGNIPENDKVDEEDEDKGKYIVALLSKRDYPHMEAGRVYYAQGHALCHDKDKASIFSSRGNAERKAKNLVGEGITTDVINLDQTANKE